MPRQRDPHKRPVVVELENGEVLKIGSIRYRGGWVPAKNLILQTMQAASVQKALKRILEALFQGDADNIDDFAGVATSRLLSLLKSGDILAELSQLIPEAVAEISNCWDELTELFIQGCVEPGEDGTIPQLNFILMTTIDVARLRDAAVSHNDWKALFELEKNSLVGVFSSMIPTDTSSGIGTASSPDGGRAGNPSSQAEATALTG